MAQYVKTEEGYKEFEAVTDDKMDKTDPTGTGSFSMNRKAGTVIGANSHAEGDDTTASGAYSHAEGSSTKASGIVSHAEGFWTKASGNYSHAEGYWTTASGEGSHTEGNQTTANGNYSHAEGTGTNKFSSVVTTTNPTTVDIINVWKNKKFSVAKGDYSHVEGKDNLALYSYSHAEGNGTIADGPSSHAEGNGTTAGGPSSHAEGYQTTASQSYSHAEGIKTTASGLSSHAEGGSTIASEQASHAEGGGTTASGYMSHAEGFNTTASGYYSHAEGDNTTASGVTTHAEGSRTRTSGESSHAEGGGTEANGNYSHAEGYNTKASGQYSHAEGSYTRASGEGSHVQGKCNIEDTSNTYADIIGNGTSNTARSNAATVDWNGNAWFAGDVYTGSTSGTNKDDGSKKLATEEYVNNSIAATSVLYTAQSLTDEQKVQARQNIGAQDLYNGLTPVSYSCTDGTYSVSDTVYLESGNIISPTDTVSNDVRLAFRNINFWGIPTKLDYWKDDIKKYKLLIDNGYLENNTIWYSKPDKKHKKQIRFGTNSTLGNYIIFNFNYNYEVVGQLVYYVDTDTISTGTDTYLNRILKRDKNNVLSYSAIKLSSDPTEPMQIATKQYVDNAPIKKASTTALGGVKVGTGLAIADDGTLSINIASASVGQIIKVKAVDDTGKPTELEAADMPSGGGEEDFELIFSDTITEDANGFVRTVDKDGNPFELKEAVVIVYTVPFETATNDLGRSVGFLPSTRWGHDAPAGISGSIPAGSSLIARYDVLHVKVVQGYQCLIDRWGSQNGTNARGVMTKTNIAGQVPINFKYGDDVTAIGELSNPQGNMTCLKIVSYGTCMAKGDVVILYGKRV